jgi:putative tryptophan/tyrosine transport system substrate-binding protein
VRRRDFITLLGGAAAVWPLAVRAQQPTMPVVGFLRSAPLADATHFVTSFRQGLKDAGFVEGQNVAVEYRSGENDRGRLSALVSEFIRQPVAVIVANVVAAVAAKAATTTVPIVFATGSDPIKDGLVTSLNRPGGNVTGISFLAEVVGAKRLEQLRQLVPSATAIALLVGPDSSDTVERRDVEAAAQAVGQQLIVVSPTNVSEIEAAFATFVQRGVGALITGGGAFMFTHREQIVALAARHAMPASYSVREFAAAGGLMSYAPSITDAYRQVGMYAGRILKGEKPGDLPVMQSTKFEFVINLKTAKAAISFPCQDSHARHHWNKPRFRGEQHDARDFGSKIRGFSDQA